MFGKTRTDKADMTMSWVTSALGSTERLASNKLWMLAGSRYLTMIEGIPEVRDYSLL